MQCMMGDNSGGMMVLATLARRIRATRWVSRLAWEDDKRFIHTFFSLLLSALPDSLLRISLTRYCIFLTVQACL